MRFHEPASIERARAPQGTRVHINKALEQAAAYALDQQPADIFRISPAFNLFDWRNNTSFGTTKYRVASSSYNAATNTVTVNLNEDAGFLLPTAASNTLFGPRDMQIGLKFLW